MSRCSSAFARANASVTSLQFALMQLREQAALEGTVGTARDAPQGPQILQKALCRRGRRRRVRRLGLQVNLRAVHDQLARALGAGLPA